MNTRFVLRVRLLALCCGLVALLLVGRLYVLQVMQGSTWSARAEAQFAPVRSPLIDRGSIFFSDKDGSEVIAATMRDVASTSERKRYYPGGSLAAQELGFVAYNNDNKQKGRYGLERYYDQTLERGTDDQYANFFVQLFTGAGRVLSGAPQEGDVTTTLEPSVQAELERTLAAYAREWSPALAGGIIMDPHTGEIYAMAVNPTFNLNAFGTEGDARMYDNQMVQSVFEMGSIIKPLTIAAGLDSGAVTPQTTYEDAGCITVSTKKICNFDGKARGTTPLQQILSQSLNLGASFVATTMGPATMRDYFLNHYKLGEETGADLPSEAHGLVSTLTGNNPVDFDTASFGQGMAITPMETVRALAALANGGKLVTPHLVRSIHYTAGITKTLAWGPDDRVLKQETSLEVSRMLTAVVDTALANGALKNPHYSIAAKTGTAQIPNPAGGGYYADRFLHSFFGYLPSYDAKFIIFLFAYEPVGAPYASQTWAKYFGSLTQFLIHYYNVAPDR